MNIRTCVCALGLTALLSACKSPPRPPVLLPSAQLQQAQQWQGHLSVKLGAFGSLPADGQSFTFFLKATTGEGQLDLMTPLGTQLAQVTWNAQSAHLDSSEGRSSYGSLNELSAQLLGEDIPVQALPHWLQGVPAPELATSQVLPDQSGFEQAGWQIDTRLLMQGRLQATRAETASQRLITIKVRLEQ